MMCRLIFNITCCFYLMVTCTLNAAAAEQKSFLFGGTMKGLRNHSKLDVEINFSATMSKLAEEYGLEINLRIYPTTEDLKTAIQKGEIYGVFSSPLEYLALQTLQIPKLAVQSIGMPLKKSVLVIVRKESKPKSLLDFKGKRLALFNAQDVEELYLNILLLKNKQVEIGQFFSKRTMPKSINVALMDVFFKRADMTIVRENEFLIATELNPQLAKQLTVLYKSPSYVSWVLTGNKDNKNFNPQIIDMILNLQSSSAGRDFLQKVNAEKFVRITHQDLQEVQELVDEYEHLSKGVAK